MGTVPSLIEQYTNLRDWILQQIKAALPFVRDGKVDLSSSHLTGALPADHLPARATTIRGAADYDDTTPPATGQLIAWDDVTSLFHPVDPAAGMRQWMQIIGTSGITVAVDPGAGTITISNATLLDTMTFGPDDLIWGGNPLGWSTT